jgi:two-component system cell cycle sensor histidine kinase/response regulator CckA
MIETRTAATVLLVEDELLISELVASALTEDGYEVHAVASAEEALRYLADGSGADILFTDINLPGMDGAALADMARQMRPDLPVVYASGRWGLLERLRAIPRSEILPKPYSLARACAAVQGLLASPVPAH